MSATSWAVMIGGSGFLGFLILIVGLPRAEKQRYPWKWRLGIVVLALSFIGWPLVYAYLVGAELEMVWMVVWFATFSTFGAGVQLLMGAAKKEEEPMRFRWASSREKNDQPIVRLQSGNEPERNATQWATHFQWGNPSAPDEEEPDEEEEKAQSFRRDNNERSMDTETQNQTALVRTCAWCDTAISLDLDVSGLGVRLKTAMDLEKVRGKIISFSLPLTDRAVPAIAPARDSEAERRGNHLVFVVCSQDCSQALRSALEQGPDIVDRIQDL